MCIYIYAQACICTHSESGEVCMYTQTYTHPTWCVKHLGSIGGEVYMYSVCMSVHIYTYICMCMCVYMYVSPRLLKCAVHKICMYVCIYMCICVCCESRSVVSDSLRSHRLYSPWNSPGQNTGVSSLSLLQGIFPTHGSNPGLQHCRRILYQLSHKGNPHMCICVYI